MSGLYVDSSAALKRVFLEPGTDDVARLLRIRIEAGELVAASSLAWVEVARSLLRSGIDDVEVRLTAALAGVAELPLSDDVIDRARQIGPPTLRSLDAIHLASAVVLNATELLTFDSRLAAAAESVGVRVVP